MAGAWALVPQWWPAVVAAVVGGAALFAWAVRRHHRVWLKAEGLRREKVVAEESGRRAGGAVAAVRWNARPGDLAGEGAREVIVPAGDTWALSEQERDDLDLYAAPVGLFGLLNRASAKVGAARLRDWLENPCLEWPRIAARQDAVRWLAAHHEERLQLTGALAALRGLDPSLAAFDAAVADVRPVLPRGAAWPVRAWTIVGAMVVVACLWLVTHGMVEWGTPILLLALVNWGATAGLRGRVAVVRRQWEEAADFAEEYLRLAQCAAGILPRDTALADVRAALEAVCAPHALPGALRWLRWSASGGLIQAVLNALVMYDVHALDGVVRHVTPHRHELLRGLGAIADVEALASLACFAAEEPGVTWPGAVEGARAALVIEAGRHPMIAPARAVGNDLALSGGEVGGQSSELREDGKPSPVLVPVMPGEGDAAHGVWVVTGSNMSGKSTFLRMVGVNVLMAQAGGAVTAAAMQWSPARLMTDLRIRDNLAKGESYFLAEVRQLRRMIVAGDGAHPIVGLVDEPFRGTNHQEQRAATLAIVEHLAGGRGLFLLATHDRDVARAAEAFGVRNWHFREELGEREMVFDYRIRPGVAATRNALRVLEREGYPNALVERAHRWAQQDAGE